MVSVDLAYHPLVFAQYTAGHLLPVFGGFRSGPGLEAILQQCEANQRFCCPTIPAVGLGFALA